MLLWMLLVLPRGWGWCFRGCGQVSCAGRVLLYTKAVTRWSSRSPCDFGLINWAKILVVYTLAQTWRAVNRGHWRVTWSLYTAKAEALEMCANIGTIPENARTPHCWCESEQPSTEFTAVEKGSSPAVGKKNILKFESHWTGRWARVLKSGRNWRDSGEICSGSLSHQHFAYCRNYAVLLGLMLDGRPGYPHQLSDFSGEWGQREADVPPGSAGQWGCNLKCWGWGPMLTAERSSALLTHTGCAGWWYQRSFWSSGRTGNLIRSEMPRSVGRLLV